MATARRRQQRRQAVDIASCVGASFGGKRVEWNEFIRRGELIIWDRHPLPMTPAIKSEMERLKKHEEQLHGNGKP